MRLQIFDLVSRISPDCNAVEHRDGRFVIWSFGRLVGWSIGRLVSWSVWSVGRFGQLVGLVGWSVGQLVGLVSWSVGRLVGLSFGQLVSCFLGFCHLLARNDLRGI